MTSQQRYAERGSVLLCWQHIKCGHIKTFCLEGDVDPDFVNIELDVVKAMIRGGEAKGEAKACISLKIARSQLQVFPSQADLERETQACAPVDSIMPYSIFLFCMN